MDKNNKDKNNKNKKFKITKLLNIVCYILSGLFILTFVFSLCNSCNNKNTNNNDNVTGTITKPKSNRYLSNDFDFSLGMYSFADVDFENRQIATSLSSNDLFDSRYDLIVRYVIRFDVDYLTINSEPLDNVTGIGFYFDSVVYYDDDDDNYVLRSDDFGWYCNNLTIYVNGVASTYNYYSYDDSDADFLTFNVTSIHNIFNVLTSTGSSISISNLSFDNMCLTYLDFNLNDYVIVNGVYYFNPVVSNKVYGLLSNSLVGGKISLLFNYDGFFSEYVGGVYKYYFARGNGAKFLIATTSLSNGVVSTRFTNSMFGVAITFDNFYLNVNDLAWFNDFFINNNAYGVSGGFYVDVNSDLISYLYDHKDSATFTGNLQAPEGRYLYGFSYSFGYTTTNDIGDLSGFKHNGITFIIDDFQTSSPHLYVYDYVINNFNDVPRGTIGTLIDNSSDVLVGHYSFNRDSFVIQNIIIPLKLNYIVIESDFYLKIDDYNHIYSFFSTTVYSVAQYRTSLQVTTLDAVFGLISKAFSSLAPLFNIVVFPNISLGLLLLIPLIITILIIIFRLVVS